MKRLSCLKITVEVFPEKRKEFEQAAPWLIQSDPEDQGETKQRILNDVENPSCFIYLRDCESREELESHLHSERFRALLGGMKLLGKIVAAEIVSPDQVEELNLKSYHSGNGTER